MNYEEALAYIHSVLWRGSKLGLSRIKELLQKAGSPERALRFIHIAGTNGKGSTASMLASILKESGFKTGLFTSPYINSFNERIQINGNPIGNDDLALVTEYIKPFAEQMEDKPTEFELVTAIGFEFFKRSGCDIVVLEVGMGGELDSTNAIATPELAVITAIGLDHMRELGDSITDIAKAKAGIIKENSDVVVECQADSAEYEVFRDACEKRRGRLHRAQHDKLTLMHSDLTGQQFSYKDWGVLELSLIGGFQMRNAATALKAVEVLRGKEIEIPQSAVRAGLKNVRWPGRFELAGQNPVFILDGGHNEQGTIAVAAELERLFNGSEITFLAGVMADKDVKNLFKPLIPLAKEFITVAPNNPRAMTAAQLSTRLRSMGAVASPAQSIAYGVSQAIKKAGADGVVCAIGSLYMLGEVRRCLS